MSEPFRAAPDRRAQKTVKCRTFDFEQKRRAIVINRSAQKGAERRVLQSDRRAVGTASSAPRTKRRAGFTVVEMAVSMALIALLTVAFIATCTVSANLQARGSNATKASSAAAEFVAAYERVGQDAADADAFFNAYHTQLAFGLGITFPFTLSDGLFVSDGAEGTTGVGINGEMDFQAEVNADGSIFYRCSTSEWSVQATAVYGGGITAEGYLSGYSKPVCSYSVGEVSA